MSELTKVTLPNNTTYNIKDEKANVAYGTCSTAAGTAAKVITLADDSRWKRDVGSIVVIKFSNTNTASNPTFAVGGTAAASVWYDTAKITTASLDMAGTANRPMVYAFDGTNYVFIGWSYDKDSNTTYTAGEGLRLSNNQFINTRFPFVVGTQTASTGKWTGVCNDITGLYDGLTIAYWLPFAGSGNATLNLTINGTATGEKNCYFKGTTRLTTHYGANNILHLTYRSSVNISGTNYEGWWSQSGYDSNDNAYFVRCQYNLVKAGPNKIFPYTFIMECPDGRWESIVTSASTGTSKACNTHGFIPGHIFLVYVNATYNENAIVGNNNIWVMHSGLIDHRYSFNTTNNATGGLTANQPVYLVGTITNGLFYLDTTKWWTQTLPSTEDGKVYMFLGKVYDYYRMSFYMDNPMYHYVNGALREFVMDATTVNGLTVETAVPQNAVFTDTTYTSKAAANGGTDVSLVTTGEKYTWNNKTSNTGTVTKVSTGVGLTGGDITTTGTVKAKLRSETALTNDSAAATETSGRVYPVAQDKSGYLAVNVPWTDNDHITTATTSGSGNAVTEITASNGALTVTKGTTFLTGHQTIKQDGVTGATVNRFGTCSTAAGTAAKTVSVTTGTFNLETGARVSVKFSNANTAETPTLNVNSKGAKNIFHNGAQITTGANKALLAGICDFVYDGTQWHLVGNYIDTNTQTVTGVKGNSESSYRTGNVNITAANIGASESGHTHNYAGSSSAGGAATSANKINTDAGSKLNPVYFSSGIPVASNGNTIPYIVGTGSTAGTWLGQLDGLTAYYDGLLILYKPSVAGAGTTTLNLNSLGAVTCYVNNTTKLGTHFPAGQPILMVYAADRNSGCWVCLDDYWTNSDTIPQAQCNTAAGTEGKGASMTYFVATAKSYLMVNIRYANTAQKALTLNVNSTGAKPIYINGTVSSTTNYTLPAGSYFVYYDGTNYYFRTDGKLTADILGDAGTVNGKTVESNVPSNAVFTDHITTATTSGSGNAVTAITASDGALTVTKGTTFLTGHQTIKQDGVTGATVNRYGACSTAANTAAKTVSVTTGTFNLEAGARVSVKFNNANTADNPTLNVNSKGAKNIFHRGSQITDDESKYLLAGVCDFIYDGTQWHFVGNYTNHEWYKIEPWPLDYLGAGYSTLTEMWSFNIPANTMVEYFFLMNYNDTKPYEIEISTGYGAIIKKSVAEGDSWMNVARTNGIYVPINNTDSMSFKCRWQTTSPSNHAQAYLYIRLRYI